MTSFICAGRGTTVAAAAAAEEAEEEEMEEAEAEVEEEETEEEEVAAVGTAMVVVGPSASRGAEHISNLFLMVMSAPVKGHRRSCEREKKRIKKIRLNIFAKWMKDKEDRRGKVR